MSETELRRLRERLSSRKHFEDALRAIHGRHQTDELFWEYAAYMSILYDIHHVSVYGLRRGGEQVDTGHPESRPPKDLTNHKSPSVRAGDLYREERKWMNQNLAPFIRVHAVRCHEKFDGIVGEDAAA